MLSDPETKHNHYYNVITGDYLTNYSACDSDDVKYCEITDIEDFVNYLSEDEIVKAQDNELTEEELIFIYERIKSKVDNVKSFDDIYQYYEYFDDFEFETYVYVNNERVNVIDNNDFGTVVNNNTYQKVKKKQ